MLNKLIVFDLNGTLAESKAAIDPEMGELLNKLLQLAKVAIISGSDWSQIEAQLLSVLPQKQYLKNLILLPTYGTKYYQYRSGWKVLYSENLTETEKKTVIENLQKAVSESELKADKLWGAQIEDRGSQITFSALGQQAPLAAKKGYDPAFIKRKKIKVILDKLLPDFLGKMGGATSIDITKPGIDKAYGIYKLHQKLNIKIRKTIFVGDAIFEDGNDYPATTTGVAYIQVKDPGETKKVIETMIACLNMRRRKHQESS